MTNYAVLTGDIVKSSQLPEGGLDRIFANLQHAADVIAGWQDAPTYLTRNRGDGWQMAVAPRFALRAVFAARAAVRMADKRFDTRIALAIGDGAIPGPTLADARGPVFTASGQALEAMPRRRDMVVAGDQGTLAIALRLSEEIIKRWTEAQAAVALRALDPLGPTQETIAAALELSQQGVQKHIEASGVDALIDVCEALDG